MPLDPGSKLGPYEIIGPLGAGGMGEVYRARDARLGRNVAVKILPSGSNARRARSRRSTIRTFARCTTSAAKATPTISSWSFWTVSRSARASRAGR